MIHIRIQQRNGRKTLTSVQGLSEEYDLNHGLKYTLHVLQFFYQPLPCIFCQRKIIKVCKRHFACNGTVVEHSEYGEVIQFQGSSLLLLFLFKNYFR